MCKKKLIKIALVYLAVIFCELGATYSYFLFNAKVENGVNVSIGTIRADFISIDNQSTVQGPLVNIKGLLPGKTESQSFKIKNAGSLTSKIAISLDNFSESEKDALLPYIDFRLVAGSTVYEGSLKDYADNNEKLIYLKGSDNTPILLQANKDIEIGLSFTLQNSTPYKAEDKSLKFSIYIHSTQPNDPQWIASDQEAHIL